jgi:hypothetical protein
MESYELKPGFRLSLSGCGLQFLGFRLPASASRLPVPGLGFAYFGGQENFAAAKRRKNAAHGASRGWSAENKGSPEGAEEDSSKDLATVRPVIKPAAESREPSAGSQTPSLPSTAGAIG